jgi:hypothetical protein
MATAVTPQELLFASVRERDRLPAALVGLTDDTRQVVADVLEADQDTKSGTSPGAADDPVVYLDEAYQTTTGRHYPNDCTDHSICICGLQTLCTSSRLCLGSTHNDCRIRADPAGSPSDLLSTLAGPSRLLSSPFGSRLGLGRSPYGLLHSANPVEAPFYPVTAPLNPFAAPRDLS